MTDKTNILTLSRLILLLIVILGIPLLPLLISGKWDWWEAWVYAGFTIFGFMISRFLAGRRHPDLIVERGQTFTQQNSEKWDQVISPLVMLAGAVTPIAAGLDMRYGPSGQFGLMVKVFSILVLLVGYVFGSYALIVNRFFSGIVRIQTERGHHVVDRGPYRWVRHPGYAGSFVTQPVIPLLLDSWWAFIPTILAMIMIIVRTSLEDRTLHEKLEGYIEYAHRVPYRLIPGVW